jgi:hypothetical protein
MAMSAVASRRCPRSNATMGAKPAQIATALPAIGPPRVHMRRNGKVMYGVNWLTANHS